MRPQKIRIFDWVTGYRNSTTFDLSRNELLEQNLSSMGVETSYSEFLKESDPDAYFRETIAELYGVESEEVIPTMGGTHAIFLAAAHLGNISPRLVVPVPDYEPLFDVPESLGHDVFQVAENEMTENLGTSDSSMMTSPGNPQGLERDGLVKSSLEVLGKVSRMYVDETFLEFRAPGRRNSLFHIDERVISSGTMTKFYGLSKLRTGWIIARKEDAADIAKLKNLTTAANPKYPLWVAANALRRKDKFESTVRNLIKKNLPRADGFVRKFDFLHWEKPDSAPFGFVRYDGNQDSEALCRNIYDKTGVLLVPGSYFGVEYAFRMCFFIEPEDAEKAFDRLTDYFEEF